MTEKKRSPEELEARVAEMEGKLDQAEESLRIAQKELEKEKHTALAVQQESNIKTLSLNEAKILAEDFHRSKRWEGIIQNQEQAVVQILAGHELGFGPIASMTKINVIRGKVATSAELMGAMIKRSGIYDYRVKRMDNDGCEISFTKDGEEIGVSKFTMEDAKRAKLLKQDSGWEKYPRNMLFARALSNGARWYCPHLIHGAYTFEEMGEAVNAMGEPIGAGKPTSKIVVEGEVVDTKKKDKEKEKTKDKEKEKPKIDKKDKIIKNTREMRDKLKSEYGVDKIKEAKEKLKLEGEGFIKMSDENFTKLVNTLEKGK